MMKIFLFFVIFSVLFHSYSFYLYYDEIDCRVLDNGKKPGHYHRYDNFMYPHETSNMSHQKSDELCSKQCKIDLDCQVAQYDYKSKICGLYYDIYRYQPSVQHVLYYYEFCHLSIGLSNKEGLPGFWFWMKNLKLKSNLTKSMWPQCREECERNPLCGGFNVRQLEWSVNECEFLELWERLKREEYIPDHSTLTYFWFTQDPFKYEVKDEGCREIEGKEWCKGKWEITQEPKNESLHLLSTFRTRDFSLCYKTCEEYRVCERVIFNSRKSICDLLSHVRQSCSSPTNTSKDKGIQVQWICCPKTQKDEDSERKVIRRKTGACRRIKSPSRMALIPLGCTFPPLNTSETCSTINKKDTVNCFENQALTSLEVFFQGFLKVSNGYQTFLVRNFSEENFPKSESSFCRLYDAFIPTNPRVRITSFLDWYPVRVHKDNGIMSLPVKYIIVGTMSHNLCPCRAWLHCVEILRQIQNNRSIPFNFLISANGYVFENRGWFNQSGSWSDEHKLLYVGFLGDFAVNDPSVESVRAFKNLTESGVTKGYIDREYILLTDYDFRRVGSVDYPSLYDIIRTLPRYNGSERATCGSIITTVIVLNAVMVATVVAVGFILSNFVFRFIHSLSCSTFGRNISKAELLRIEINSLDIENVGYFKYTSFFKDFAINETKYVTMENTSFFWLNERKKPSPCSKKHNEIHQILRLHRKRGQMVSLDHLVKDDARCGHRNVFLIFQAEMILCDTSVVILHLEEENFHSEIKIFLSIVASRNCLCFRYDLYHLPTDSEVTRFKKLLC